MNTETLESEKEVKKLSEWVFVKALELEKGIKTLELLELGLPCRLMSLTESSRIIIELIILQCNIKDYLELTDKKVNQFYDCLKIPSVIEEVSRRRCY